ncbi:MAG: type II toxin-antitoxin system VapC family toxin [Candidatus Electronema sp. VV]
MTALLDTIFLLAMTNGKDRNHDRVLDVAAKSNDRLRLILPVTVLPEVSYLIGSHLGHAAMRQFLRKLAASEVAIEPVTMNDLKRATEILTAYTDSNLDFVEATIVALAERLNITRIFTLDGRYFTIIPS